MKPERSLTEILRAAGSSEAGAPAAEQIFDAAYQELRRLAADLMRRERADHTLQPTALVNEAFLRLVDVESIAWEDRAHFFGIAARAMRQVLIDHWRKRATEKRGGDWHRVTLDSGAAWTTDPEMEWVELDDALRKLSNVDSRMATVVELRVFGGLSAEEVAHVLGVTKRTILNDWRIAKMWLRRHLERDDS